MLDFQAVRDERITFADLVAGLTTDDLHELSDEMVDTILDLTSECIDADVVFEPDDPEADDPYAKTDEEVDIAWTLGHVIVHTTASAEESAAIAAELARGVRYHGRSRYETPWGEMRTMDECRRRLEESRRMRLASLEMWPEEPHLENGYRLWKGEPNINAIGRFVLGLMHEEEHLEQMAKIVRQAKVARGNKEMDKKMTDDLSKVKVAVVQAAPVLFDRQATVEKACSLIHEAAAEGAQLTLFPEAFIPAYPRGLSFGMVVGSRSAAGRRIWQMYWDNAVDIPGPATEALSEAVRETGMVLAMGVIERDTQFGSGTLYCTLLYFGPDGAIIGKHRKLKPTAAERLIWGEGDGSTLTVLETEIGKIGGLICWENYMPLARMTLYSKGVQLYLAPTADTRDTWQATLQHIACEGRCFVLGCNQFVTKEMYPASLADHPELVEQPEIMCRGGSAIISPMGEVIAGPLYDQEGILCADLDLGKIVRSKVDFDVVGHYARPDVFQLIVDEGAKAPVQIKTDTNTMDQNSIL